MQLTSHGHVSRSMKPDFELLKRSPFFPGHTSLLL
jgi:hypothetical protein